MLVTSRSTISVSALRAVQQSAAFVLLLARFTVSSAAAGSVFSKSSWNEYSPGEAPDVKRDFSAPYDGCTGFMYKGSPCAGKNHGEVSKSPSGGDNVLMLHFPRGLYASQSGGQFYKDLSLSESGVLEYEVYFPSGFSWTKGGKLPGLYGGDKMCSGSKLRPNGENCFSTRLMWRENGIGEAYMYLPFAENEDNFCRQCAYPTGSTCKALAGAEFCAWDRGSFRFKAGSWNKVRQVVKLNTPGKPNGKFELYVNGRKVAASTNVVYRTTGSLKISGMLFSTFFGGDSSSYAPRSDQEIYFRGIRISA